MSRSRILGVGVDTERCDALARTDATALRRFGARWLTPAERAWCSGQPDPARATVLCVSGKEAVWKAIGGTTGLDRIGVAGPGGLRERVRIAGADVALAWTLGPSDVVVTAIAVVP